MIAMVVLSAMAGSSFWYISSICPAVSRFTSEVTSGPHLFFGAGALEKPAALARTWPR